MATELERMMAELLAGADETKTGADDARKSAAKTRRRSRDLEMQLNEMVSVQESMQTMIQFRRNSKDAELNEAEAKTIFDEIDTDKSGKLGKDELLAAFKKADPTATVEQVAEMIKYADANGDGEVDFGEFFKALTTKHTPAAGAAAPAAS